MMPSLLLISNLLHTVLGCRWATYAGKDPIQAAELLFVPSHGLVQQAIRPPILPGWDRQLKFRADATLERNHPENLDGFGVGWYERSGSGALEAKRERSGAPAVDDGGAPHPTLARVGARELL